MLTFCWDLAPANWIVDRDLPWDQLVGFGPSGFNAYARLRLLPDPAQPGQSENDVGAHWRIDQLPTLWKALAAHTETPDDCYFCVWDGYGDDNDTNNGATPSVLGEIYRDPSTTASESMRSPAQPGLDPARSPSRSALPQVAVPDRSYFLFHGPLSDADDWAEAELLAGQTRLHAPEPALVWPADRAWCVARDVDPHWAGIGADTHVIDQLVSDTRLDLVRADPTEQQPYYR